MPFIIRAANRKQPAEIHREIRRARQEEAPPALAAARWLPLWLRLPGFLRRFVWTALLGNPHRRKQLTGSALVTAVGMFGRSPAWGIPMTAYTLCVTVGGISRKPGVLHGGADRQEERVEVREVLALAASVDHDLIDGAPATRFVARLKELIEGGVSTIGRR